MNETLIIMYHYVRDFNKSKYTGLKGLQVELFEEQVKFINKNYKIVKMEDIYESILSKKKLPPNSALLTFDDGYIDHFQYAFPILKKLGLQGSFFPPVLTAQKKEVLDVNIIHHVLGKVEDSKKLLNFVLDSLSKYRSDYFLESNQFYLDKYLIANRFDLPETIFVKRMLQVGLPYELRRKLCLELLKEYLDISEIELANDLYMGLDHISTMVENGMYFGGHGYKHKWLNSLDVNELEFEIDQTIIFLESIGMDTSQWALCYPYGGFNDQVLSVLNKKSCLLGFTTEMRKADFVKENPLLIPRLDTNDVQYR